MDRSQAEAFAAEWIAHWNAHDLDAIMSHYHDDVVFHSPGIRRVTGRDIDSVSGKVALRNYWAGALEQIPGLRFELTSVLVGSDALTILYRNDRGRDAAETFIFADDGRVVRSVATYSA